jgi:hypothetical protein
VGRLATGVVLDAAFALHRPRWAAAQDSPSDVDRATARALAHDGYEAQKQGRYALAADRFERAEALIDAPTLLLGLARAQAAMGKIVEASESYRRILRKPLPPDAPPAFARAVEDARHEGASISTRLAWVTLDVKGPASPRVVLDDVPVPKAALGIPLACNPGTHTARASAEGALSAAKSFAIGEGAADTVSLTLEPVATEQASGTSTRAQSSHDASNPLHDEEPPAPHPSSWQAAAGLTALGLGIAGLGIGGVSGIVALSKHATLSHACPDGQCPAQVGGEVDTYRTWANVSTGATIVGAAGVAAGAILFLSAPRSKLVHVYAGALRAGIAGRF